MNREAGDLVQLKLRFRESTRQELETAAEVAGRSLNSEIVWRLEESLRGDNSLGGGEQAWLLKRVVHIMDLVSEEYTQPWWKSARSWRLVFRSCFYLLTQYKPVSSADATKSLSSAGETEIQRWNDAYKASERDRLEQAYDRVGFNIAKVALKDEYAAKRVVQTSETIPDPAPLPKLNRADMRVWLQDRQAEQKYIEAWRQVLPTLRLTRTRRRRQRIL